MGRGAWGAGAWAGGLSVGRGGGWGGGGAGLRMTAMVGWGARAMATATVGPGRGRRRRSAQGGGDGDGRPWARTVAMRDPYFVVLRVFSLGFSLFVGSRLSPSPRFGPASAGCSALRAGSGRGGSLPDAGPPIGAPARGAVWGGTGSHGARPRRLDPAAAPAPLPPPPPLRPPPLHRCPGRGPPSAARHRAGRDGRGHVRTRATGGPPDREMGERGGACVAGRERRKGARGRGLWRRGAHPRAGGLAGPHPPSALHLTSPPHLPSSPPAARPTTRRP